MGRLAKISAQPETAIARHDPPESRGHLANCETTSRHLLVHLGFRAAPSAQGSYDSSWTPIMVFGLNRRPRVARYPGYTRTLRSADAWWLQHNRFPVANGGETPGLGTGYRGWKGGSAVEHPAFAVGAAEQGVGVGQIGDATGDGVVFHPRSGAVGDQAE